MGARRCERTWPSMIQTSTRPNVSVALGTTRLTELPADMTVAALKARLATARASDGWSAELNLINQGRFLDDDATLEGSGLRDGDFLVATGCVPHVLPPMPPDEMPASEPDDDRVQYIEMPGAMPELPPGDPMRRV